jgi:outer membrane protein OmpU
MNKMKKIGLTALAASLVSVSANAVDISGGASISYNGGNGGENGNPWSMNDGLTFTWGGELDNGMTVDLSFLIDSGDGAAAAIMDNRSLAIGMNDLGTLTFHGDGGSGVVGSFDDRMPTAYEESWYSGDSPNTGHSANNMFYYTNNLGAATVDVSITPRATGEDASSVEIGATTTAIENLEVGIAFGTDSAAAAAEVDNTQMYAKYTMGGATIGMHSNEADSATAGAGFDNRSLAIGMNDTGTLTFHGDGGSGVVGSFDDKMPTAYEESWYSADSPNQGHSTNNMFYYTNTLDAATIHASFTPASGGSDASSLEIGATTTAIDNLEVGVAIGEDNGAAEAVDNTILYAKYTMGGATFGVQKNEADSATAGSDEEFVAYGVSYAVSEDMSVSYGYSELKYEAAADQEATGFSASYTMGSMTLAGTLNNIKNEGSASTGAGNTKKDSSDTFELNLAFAF